MFRLYSILIKKLTPHYLFICISFLSLFICGCSKTPDNPLKIGSNIWIGYEGFYLASDLNLFEDISVNLITYPSNTEVMRAYRQGGIDLACLTMDEALLLAQHEMSFKVVLILDFSHGGDVILGRGNIKRMTDLKGKPVGVENTALGALMLARALEIYEMKNDEITVIPLGVNDHESAFNDNIIDGVVTFEPVLSKLLSKGANVLFDSTQIPGEIIDVLIVRTEVLNHRYDELRKLLDGWFKALDYLLIDNPQKAATLASERKGIDSEQFLSSLEGIHLPDANENLLFFAGKKALFVQRISKLQSIMMKNDLLQKQIDPLSILDSRLLKPR